MWFVTILFKSQKSSINEIESEIASIWTNRSEHILGYSKDQRKLYLEKSEKVWLVCNISSMRDQD